METLQLVTQTPSPKPFVIPLSLLMLDLFGLAVVGLGLAEQVGEVHFLPEQLRLWGGSCDDAVGCGMYVAASVEIIKDIKAGQATRK